MNNTINNYLTDAEIKLIKGKKIGVAGCGGLGSNILNHLVRAGLTDFIIVDFDTVSTSNLNRQFYFYDQIGMKKVEAIKDNLFRINANLNIESHHTKIEKDNIFEIFKDCDIIVEAFDNERAKLLLINEFSNTNIKIVAGSGMAKWGNSDAIIVKKIGKNLYLVGDFVSKVDANNPPQSPRVGIVAAKQANTVLAILLNEKI